MIGTFSESNVATKVQQTKDKDLSRYQDVPLVLIEQLACLDDWPILKTVKCITVGAEVRSAVHF